MYLVTFKGLKKRVSLVQVSQQQSETFEQLRHKPSGYGILKNTASRRKISKNTDQLLQDLSTRQGTACRILWNNKSKISSLDY
jgi:hypothetical protein